MSYHIYFPFVAHPKNGVKELRLRRGCRFHAENLFKKTISKMS